jgi:nucleotide-binding universal stress UspA family protein
MFTHILIPIDGSTLSEAAVRNGVRFAKEIGARVTAFHVVPRRGIGSMIELEREDGEAPESAAARNEAVLDYARKTANAAGVDCDVASAAGDDPFREIIRAAEERACDLILMGSHGRRGLEAMLLGSETQKVLTHSRIPVLVYR